MAFTSDQQDLSTAGRRQYSIHIVAPIMLLVLWLAVRAAQFTQRKVRTVFQISPPIYMMSGVSVNNTFRLGGVVKVLGA